MQVRREKIGGPPGGPLRDCVITALRELGGLGHSWEIETRSAPHLTPIHVLDQDLCVLPVPTSFVCLEEQRFGAQLVQELLLDRPGMCRDHEPFYLLF